jgi:hypothetical protein
VAAGIVGKPVPFQALKSVYSPDGGANVVFTISVFELFWKRRSQFAHWPLAVPWP